MQMTPEIVARKDMDDLKAKMKEIISMKHINYLLRLGMVANIAKLSSMQKPYMISLKYEMLQTNCNQT